MSDCPSCNATLPPDAGFCTTCGAPAPPLAASCLSCGSVIRPGGRFCEVCGTPVEPPQPPSSGPPLNSVPIGPPPPGAAPLSGAFATGEAFGDSPYPPAASLGTPGIGIAGFIVSLLGFSLIGIILSWIGYSQAKREGRPKGLCVAGIVIGFVWLVIAVVVVLFMVVFAASVPTETYSY